MVFLTPNGHVTTFDDKVTNFGQLLPYRQLLPCRSLWPISQVLLDRTRSILAKSSFFLPVLIRLLNLLLYNNRFVSGLRRADVRYVLNRLLGYNTFDYFKVRQCLYDLLVSDKPGYLPYMISLGQSEVLRNILDLRAWTTRFGNSFFGRGVICHN